MNQTINLSPTQSQEQASPLLFYGERILDLAQNGYVQLARLLYERFEEQWTRVFPPSHAAILRERALQTDAWSDAKQEQLWQRLNDAMMFQYYQVAHDCAHEILLHHQHKAEDCPTHDICEPVGEQLAICNAHYIEPHEIEANAYVDAEVRFWVDKRNASSGGASLKGNPGFYWQDALGTRYRCFIKQADEAHVGDTLKLKITNIPGLQIDTPKGPEPILYLEPRVLPGETLLIELDKLSYTGNSFTFRYNSYDGFLWFKRRGINKEVFNQETLQPGQRIYAKVLYTTDQEKRTREGKVTRLGIIKAIPLQWAGSLPRPAQHPDTAAAKAQG